MSGIQARCIGGPLHGRLVTTYTDGCKAYRGGVPYWYELRLFANATAQHYFLIGANVQELEATRHALRLIQADCGRCNGGGVILVAQRDPEADAEELPCPDCINTTFLETEG